MRLISVTRITGHLLRRENDRENTLPTLLIKNTTARTKLLKSWRVAAGRQRGRCWRLHPYNSYWLHKFSMRLVGWVALHQGSIHVYFQNFLLARKLRKENWTKLATTTVVLCREAEVGNPQSKWLVFDRPRNTFWILVFPWSWMEVSRAPEKSLSPPQTTEPIYHQIWCTYLNSYRLRLSGTTIKRLNSVSTQLQQAVLFPYECP